MRCAARLCVALAAILSLEGTAAAQTNYTFIALDPQDSSASSIATDVNDQNTVLGTRIGGAYKWTAVGGEQPLISDPVANSKFPATGAFQINNAGTVMGTGCPNVCFSGPFVPATWSATAGLVFLPLTEPPFGTAKAINNAGTIVGSGRFTPAIWRPGQPQQPIVGLNFATDVNNLEQVLGECYGDVCGPAGTVAVWTQAGGRVLIPRLPGHLPDVPYSGLAINNNGMVVGKFGTSPSSGVFFWSASTGTIDLHLPGTAEYLDINDRGIVATISGPVRVPYLFKKGVWTNLNTLVPAGTHMVLTRVTAINNNGWMTGSGSNFPADFSSGYVLIPPTVQVTANGTDGPLTLHPGQPLQIAIGFDAHGVGTVSPAELYLGLAGPFGVVWFTPSGLSLSPGRFVANFHSPPSGPWRCSTS